MPEEAASCELCGAPASQRCSMCRQAAYCSRQHQKQHWPTHKAGCRCYEVRTSAELGRHLVATRDVEAGAAVLGDAPLVVGPRVHRAADEAPACLGCLLPLPLPPEAAALARCPRCLWPLCAPCAAAGAPDHAAECRLLRLSAGRAGWLLAAITPLRCLLLQKRHPRRWQLLADMQAHEDQRGPGTDAYTESGEVSEFLRKKVLCGEAGEAVEDASDAAIRRVCGVLDVNALDITLPGGGEASALYPTAYLLEHSCVPNTRHTFDFQRGCRLTVRAAKLISRGEHISTMYTHALWGTQARREHLRATKYFECRCPRCADPTELGTHLSAMRCLGTLTESDAPACGGIQLPTSPLDPASDWRCDRCPVSLPAAHVAELVSRLGDEVDKTQQERPTVESLETLLEKLDTFLHPHHYHSYSVKHSLLQLYGQQRGYAMDQLSDQQLARKEALCRELLLTTNCLDPGYARLALYTGVLLHELSRSLLESARRSAGDRSALEQLLEARALLATAQRALQPEPPGSAGERMLQLVRGAQHEVEARFKEA
ncbi:SET domain-containing protein SmydA-8-like [Schistocerca serialis cubense]|uniref:SET domain-containing protein SmydA-8-like n=1 Tax=Schistocerca serialis cubense TaxID=2023355 RepID=UPI00214F1A22|nr:SET domain-containing protein SmydA-8-like [Schistocerca serialis cubense]